MFIQRGLLKKRGFILKLYQSYIVPIVNEVKKSTNQRTEIDLTQLMLQLKLDIAIRQQSK
ncbi:hypothetical protein AWH48_16780 [Domibacillus aminovorans]|uniref:Uncharacterized protein n=1 Tax=Domibacillus aminovorans TaxID=29332 RepID=A0A177KZP5_9BACI|nr:hypothetical protein AWH48_16780 [Domibacillus aminovorans]